MSPQTTRSYSVRSRASSARRCCGASTPDGNAAPRESYRSAAASAHPLASSIRLLGAATGERLFPHRPITPHHRLETVAFLGPLPARLLPLAPALRLPRGHQGLLQRIGQRGGTTQPVGPTICAASPTSVVTQGVPQAMDSANTLGNTSADEEST